MDEWVLSAVHWLGPSKEHSWPTPALQTSRPASLSRITTTTTYYPKKSLFLWETLYEMHQCKDNQVECKKTITPFYKWWMIFLLVSLGFNCCHCFLWCFQEEEYKHGLNMLSSAKKDQKIAFFMAVEHVSLPSCRWLTFIGTLFMLR